MELFVSHGLHRYYIQLILCNPCNLWRIPPKQIGAICGKYVPHKSLQPAYVPSSGKSVQSVANTSHANRRILCQIRPIQISVICGEINYLKPKKSIANSKTASVRKIRKCPVPSTSFKRACGQLSATFRLSSTFKTRS